MATLTSLLALLSHFSHFRSLTRSNRPFLVLSTNEVGRKIVVVFSVEVNYVGVGGN